MHNQQLAATLRRFDASQRRLEKSQRILERSQARLAAAGAAIDRSIDTLVMCEMAHDVCPRNALLYKQLVVLSSWSCGPVSLKQTRFSERALQRVEFHLHLRDALELDGLLVDYLIQYLAPLVQQVDELVQFFTAHVRAAAFGNARDTTPTRTRTPASHW